jgi:hypothetical protein
MAMLFLESTGPNGERLAEEAAGRIGAAVGIDPEGGVTVDSDSHDEDGLQAALFDALAGLDPDWQSQLRVAE